MPNHYDKIVKEIMDAVYLSLSKKFINANYSKIEELGTELQSTREKKTDFLRKIEYENLEDSFVLHAEAQSKDDPRMQFRMLLNDFFANHPSESAGEYFLPESKKGCLL